MTINEIVKRVNRLLSGEMLIYSELEEHLDSVIDDINARLNSNYPAFSEFKAATHPTYPDYNFFPERYMRSVVLPGAATKFYTQDTEGIEAAPEFMRNYQTNLFYMERDYLEHVPTAYQAVEKRGLLTQDPTLDGGIWINNGYFE